MGSPACVLWQTPRVTAAKCVACFVGVASVLTSVDETSAAEAQAGTPSLGALARADAFASVSSPNEPLAVRLELDLPEGCGTLNGFVERLRARIDRIRFAEEGVNRIVQARIESNSVGAYRATMTLRYPDGHSSSRIVDALNCNDAVEALALITAVTLDPLGSGVTDHAASPVDGVRRTQDATDSQTGPLTPAAKRASPKESASSAAQGSTAPVTHSAPRLGVGIGAAFSSFRGPSPGLLEGFELSVLVLQRRPSPLSFSARLGVSYTVNTGVLAPGGVADFSLTSAVLDLCPVQQSWTAIELRACGVTHAGLLIAKGRATESAQSHHRPTLAFGTSGQLTWLPWEFLAVPLRAHLAFPIGRDTFAFDPLAFYRVPSVSYNVTAGLEARFR